MTAIPAAVPRHKDRGAVAAACHRADTQLGRVSSQFDHLLCLSPVNTSDAMEKWLKGSHKGDPDFQYRDLEFDPRELRRSLHAIDLTALHEPIVEGLLLEKRRDIDLQLAMLAHRGKVEFLQASEQMYGAVSSELLETARDILKRTADVSDEPADRTHLDASALVNEARSRVAHYRRHDPEFDPEIEIREDVDGLLVSFPKLMIDARSHVRSERVDPLLSHEISVHLVTGYNGSKQALGIFSTGLAGYEEFQEGLGVFAEWCVGGLSAFRLRLVAARAIAVHHMLGGADFGETFSELQHRCSLDDYTAFKVAARAYRSGGFAKDAIYLRGFLRVLEWIADDGDLEPFWAGKIAPVHVPLIDQLKEYQLVCKPRLIPEFITRDSTLHRIARYRQTPTLKTLLAVALPSGD